MVPHSQGCSVAQHLHLTQEVDLVQVHVQLDRHSWAAESGYPPLLALVEAHSIENDLCWVHPICAANTSYFGAM